MIDGDPQADAIDAACRRFMWDGEAMVQALSPDVAFSDMPLDDGGRLEKYLSRARSGRASNRFRHGRASGLGGALGAWRRLQAKSVARDRLL